MKGVKTVSILLVLAFAGIALAQGVNPPEKIPVWVWTVLGAVLPWIYATFIRKIPNGFLKWLISWGITAVIAFVVGLIIYHGNISQLVESFAWLIMVMQAMYQLLTKPTFKKLDSR